MKSILLVISFLCIPFFATSQSNNKILLLKHKHKNRFKYIKPGKMVKYWHEDSRGIKNKGRITSIKDTVFFIDGKPVHPENLAKIAAKTTGHTIASFAGGAVIATGTLVSGAGVMLIVNSRNDSGCDAAMATIVGIVATATGVTAIAIGSIPLVIGGKRYDLYHDWDLIITEELDRKAMKKEIENGEISAPD